MHPDHITIHWFRRDLRLIDNWALSKAHKVGNVIGLFIFDSHILSSLKDVTDGRITFIYNTLLSLRQQIRQQGGELILRFGKPEQIWQDLLVEFSIAHVYANADYEPYAIQRDKLVQDLLSKKSISFHTCKDHVVLDPLEVLKDDGNPYTVFTPYSKKWKALLTGEQLKPAPSNAPQWASISETKWLSLEDIGFRPSTLHFPPAFCTDELLRRYGQLRNFPAVPATSRLGLHLRFGTISVRSLFQQSLLLSDTYTNELIWREFYQMILFHFPKVVNHAFKPAYDRIVWRNNESEFERWCQGKTGYPLVDAGMRELNATGYMHNRVRMVTASFLTKHLLIDWRWGEAYFAERLLDFELASNNGGWQWAAGTGCDAAPYFRIFNPAEQARKFDPDGVYIRRWVPEFDSLQYALPIVDHKTARIRALETYKAALRVL